MIINDYDLNIYICNKYRIYILSDQNERSLEMLYMIKLFLRTYTFFFINYNSFINNKYILKQNKKIFVLEVDDIVHKNIICAVRVFFENSSLLSVLIIVCKKILLDYNKYIYKSDKCLLLKFDELNFFNYKKWVKQYICFYNNKVSNIKIKFLSLFFFQYEEKFSNVIKLNKNIFYKFKFDVKNFVLTINSSVFIPIKKINKNNNLLYYYKKIEKRYVKNINKFILSDINLIKLDILFKNRKFNDFFIKSFKCISKHILKKVVKHDK